MVWLRLEEGKGGLLLCINSETSFLKGDFIYPPGTCIKTFIQSGKL